MEGTISLKELLQILRKRLALIAVITMTAVLVTGMYNYFFYNPIYQASSQLLYLFNQSENEPTVFNPNEAQTNQQLINTYNAIIKSPAILDIVVKEQDLSMTSTQLKGKMTVQSENNSQVINITVQDSNATKAANIANKIADVFQNEIVKIMNVDNVRILAKAPVADHPVPIEPNWALNIAMALVVGFMAGAGLALLLEYFNNTIKTEKDIEKY